MLDDPEGGISIGLVEGNTFVVNKINIELVLIDQKVFAVERSPPFQQLNDTHMAAESF